MFLSNSLESTVLREKTTLDCPVEVCHLALLLIPVFFSPEGPYIYVEANKFSVAGQSFRLVSRPFCAPGAICVEFAYHMYGLGEGTKLSLLLESPAGSAPSTLWHRTGSQSPNWLNASVTIPLGHQQPMQVRGRESGPVSVCLEHGEGALMLGYHEG